MVNVIQEQELGHQILPHRLLPMLQHVKLHVKAPLPQLSLSTPIPLLALVELLPLLIMEELLWLILPMEHKLATGAEPFLLITLNPLLLINAN
jgi:hypothetical protein